MILRPCAVAGELADDFHGAVVEHLEIGSGGRLLAASGGHVRITRAGAPVTLEGIPDRFVACGRVGFDARGARVIGVIEARESPASFVAAWSAATGALERTESCPRPAAALAFCAGHHRLISTEAGAAVVRDASSLAVERAISASREGARITAAAGSSDGAWLFIASTRDGASGASASIVERVDLRSGEVAARSELLSKPARGMVLLRGERVLLVAQADAYPSIALSALDLSIEERVAGGAPAATPDGRRLVAACSTTRVIDGETLRELASAGSADAAAISADGETLAISKYGVLRVGAPEALREWILAPHTIDALAVSGGILVAPRSDGTVAAFGLGALERIDPPHASVEQIETWRGLRSPSGRYRLEHRPDTRVYGTGSDDFGEVVAGSPEMLVVADLKNGCAAPSPDGLRPSGVFMFSPAGERLVLGDDPHDLVVWGLEGGGAAGLTRLERPEVSPLGAIERFVWTGDAAMVIGGAELGWIARWDAATGKLARFSAGAGAPVAALAVSPDRRLLAVGRRHDPRGLRLVDLDTLEPVAELAGHVSGVRALCFDPAGRLYSAGEDGRVMAWDLSSTRPTHR